MALTVVFFLMLTFPDKPPITHDHKAESLQECLEDVAAALNKISPRVMEVAGGTIQAGCWIQPDTSKGAEVQ